MTDSHQTPETTSRSVQSDDSLPSNDGVVSDAVSGNLVDTVSPASIRPFLRLSRVDRPIGFWTLIIPSWWGLFAAAASTGWRALDWWILIAVALGAILMRGAGCTWNDITDREIDARVERTKSRPLPSGQVTVKQAFVWMGIQLLLAFLILLTFNATAIWIGIASLALVALYPFGKRITWWPQFILGLNLSWGVLVAWAAHAGSLSPAPFLLFFGGVSWTIFYDTIYAHQDIEDDNLVGIKSTALLFGDETKSWLHLFTLIAVLMWTMGVIAAVPPTDGLFRTLVGLGGVAAMGWHMRYLSNTVNLDDPKSCLVKFRALRETGLILVVTLLLVVVI